MEILILLSMFILSTVGESPSGHVIGGYSCNNYYPYQISIRATDTNEHLAGGVIVTSKFLLTGAHCACSEHMPLKNAYIFAGSNKLSGPGVKYKIDAGICHKNYTDDYKHDDIALIAIKGNFIYKRTIKPISIFMKDVPVGFKVTVTGWGYTDYPEEKLTDQLQTAQIPVISLKECAKAYSEYNVTLLQTQFCTFYKKARIGTCRGDSGGPVTFHGLLVGLVSWGIPCVEGKPDTNTKVSKYKSWINTTINKYCKKKKCPKKRYPSYV